MKKLTFIVLFAFYLSAIATAKNVSLNDPAIQVNGAKYTNIKDDGMEFLRFSPDVFLNPTLDAIRLRSL